MLLPGAIGLGDLTKTNLLGAKGHRLHSLRQLLTDVGLLLREARQGETNTGTTVLLVAMIIITAMHCKHHHHSHHNPHQHDHQHHLCLHQIPNGTTILIFIIFIAHIITITTLANKNIIMINTSSPSSSSPLGQSRPTGGKA